MFFIGAWAYLISVAANPATPDADEPGIHAIIEQLGTFPLAGMLRPT